MAEIRYSLCWLATNPLRNPFLTQFFQFHRFLLTESKKAPPFFPFHLLLLGFAASMEMGDGGDRRNPSENPSKRKMKTTMQSAIDSRPSKLTKENDMVVEPAAEKRAELGQSSSTVTTVGHDLPPLLSQPMQPIRLPRPSNRPPVVLLMPPSTQAMPSYQRPTVLLPQSVMPAPPPPPPQQPMIPPPPQVMLAPPLPPQLLTSQSPGMRPALMMMLPAPPAPLAPPAPPAPAELLPSLPSVLLPSRGMRPRLPQQLNQHAVEPRIIIWVEGRMVIFMA